MITVLSVLPIHSRHRFAREIEMRIRYEPSDFLQIINMINVEQEITMGCSRDVQLSLGPTFAQDIPNTADKWKGFISKFVPEPVADGETPLAVMTITLMEPVK